jgi:hypothetical protein
VSGRWGRQQSYPARRAAFGTRHEHMTKMHGRDESLSDVLSSHSPSRSIRRERDMIHTIVVLEHKMNAVREPVHGLLCRGEVRRCYRPKPMEARETGLQSRARTMLQRKDRQDNTPSCVLSPLSSTCISSSTKGLSLERQRPDRLIDPIDPHTLSRYDRRLSI